MVRKIVEFGLICGLVLLLAGLSWERGVVKSAETTPSPTLNPACFGTSTPYPAYPIKDQCGINYLPLSFGEYNRNSTPTPTTITPTLTPTATPTPTLTPSATPTSTLQPYP